MIDIRDDFQEDKLVFILKKLWSFRNQFLEFDNNWSHLRNKEDFSKIYDRNFPENRKKKSEDIYSNGRDMALSLSNYLELFNDIRRFHDLTSYIKFLEEKIVIEEKIFSEIMIDDMDICLFSVKEMTKLYKEQVRLMDFIKNYLNGLKNTETYNVENNIKKYDSIFNHEDVIKRIRKICKNFEKTPESYEKLGEEDLRNMINAGLFIENDDIFISGETFNKFGKTDILISKGDDVLFIGECKIWNGPSGVEKAIDQLFNYLNYHNINAAIIFFVKKGNINDVIKKTNEKICRHKFFKETLKEDINNYTYKFNNPEHPEDIKLTIIFCHINKRK